MGWATNTPALLIIRIYPFLSAHLHGVSMLAIYWLYDEHNFCYNTIWNLIFQQKWKTRKRARPGFFSSPVSLPVARTFLERGWRWLWIRLNLICALIRFRFCRLWRLCFLFGRGVLWGGGWIFACQDIGSARGIHRAQLLCVPAILIQPIRYAMVTAYCSPLTTLFPM